MLTIYTTKTFPIHSAKKRVGNKKNANTQTGTWVEMEQGVKMRMKRTISSKMLENRKMPFKA